MSAASELRSIAIAALQPGAEFHLESDDRSIPGVVLLAVAQPHLSCVLAIDKAEWNPLKTAEILGFTQLKPPTALERAKQLKGKP